MTAASSSRRARKGDLVSARLIWRAWGTDADRIAWRASEFSKGMTCAGETQLPPRAVERRPEGESFRVLKMRAKSCPTSWGLAAPKGCCLLIDEDGVEWFSKPHLLRVV